jgi:hypothetical protein
MRENSPMAAKTRRTRPQAIDLGLKKYLGFFDFSPRPFARRRRKDDGRD